jgi:DNA-binding transcriptional LysR family regulator
LWDRGLPADIVAEYRRRYPTVKLDMTTGYSQSNMDRLVSGEIDFAFIGPAVAPRPGVVMRPLDRQEVVVVMPPTHRFMQMKRVPIESLRGESIVAATPGINPNLNAVSLDWLSKYTGEPPNIIRQEPPDQVGAALSQSGNAIAFMTEHRAVIARTEGLDYRPLTPALVVEFGLAYGRDNPSPALANLIATVDEIAPELSPELPDGSELLARQVGPPSVIKKRPG